MVEETVQWAALSRLVEVVQAAYERGEIDRKEAAERALWIWQQSRRLVAGVSARPAPDVGRAPSSDVEPVELKEECEAALAGA